MAQNIKNYTESYIILKKILNTRHFNQKIMFYKRIIRPILFKIDPEVIHDIVIHGGKLITKISLFTELMNSIYFYSHKSLRQNIDGIKFLNPVGLSAGFDKDARLIDLMYGFGFGFAEIGSVTYKPYKGNKKPRLWRLPKRESIVVYYGLKSIGSQEVAKSLYGRRYKIPFGINIAKTNCKETVDTETGIIDYCQAFKILEPYGQYFTINISCPNTFGGQPFTSPHKLDQLLTELEKIETDKPVYLKLSPDLTGEELDSLLKVCDDHRIQGFIISNLTKNRDKIGLTDKELKHIGPGGLSGKPVAKLSNEMISTVYKKSKGRYTIVGVGGVFNANDAYEKIIRGADLVQLITGFIYEGPNLIKNINKGLVKLLKKDGFNHISEAVGSFHKQ